MADEVQITQSVLEAVGQKTGDANVEVTQVVFEAAGRKTSGDYVEVTQLVLEAAYCAAPHAPTLLAAATNSGNTVILTWTNNSEDSEIRIERSLDEITWTQITTVVAGTTTYTDHPPDYNTVYYYRVRH